MPYVRSVWNIKAIQRPGSWHKELTLTELPISDLKLTRVQSDSNMLVLVDCCSHPTHKKLRDLSLSMVHTWVFSHPCSDQHLGGGNSHLLLFASSTSHVKQSSGMASPLFSEGLWRPLLWSAIRPTQFIFPLASEPSGNVLLSCRDVKPCKGRTDKQNLGKQNHSHHSHQWTPWLSCLQVLMWVQIGVQITLKEITFNNAMILA